MIWKKEIFPSGNWKNNLLEPGFTGFKDFQDDNQAKPGLKNPENP
ncbi:hypothetical protein [Desulfonema limicola]|nr:hypothetical protein [Desulfonema limicola]